MIFEYINIISDHNVTIFYLNQLPISKMFPTNDCLEFCKYLTKNAFSNNNPDVKEKCLDTFYSIITTNLSNRYKKIIKKKNTIFQPDWLSKLFDDIFKEITPSFNEEQMNTFKSLKKLSKKLSKVI